MRGNVPSRHISSVTITLLAGEEGLIKEVHGVSSGSSVDLLYDLFLTCFTGFAAEFSKLVLDSTNNVTIILGELGINTVSDKRRPSLKADRHFFGKKPLDEVAAKAITANCFTYFWQQS